MKKQFSRSVFILFAGAILLAAAASASNTSSDWAASEVASAIESRIVPEGIQQDYTNSITRAEFCALIVRISDVWSQEGKIQPLPKRQLQATGAAFQDTDAADVLACAALGIVNGDGNGHFYPDNPVTRQEAAKILKNASDVLQGAVNSDASLAAADMPHVFDDGKTIDMWARPAVNWVYRNGVLLGIGGNRFDAQGTFTREQAILTALRLYRSNGAAETLQKPPADYYPLGDESLRLLDCYLGSDLTLYSLADVSYTYPVDSEYMKVIDNVGVGVSYGHITDRRGERMLTDFRSSNGYFYTIRLNGSIAQVRLRDADPSDLNPPADGQYTVNLDTGAEVDAGTFSEQTGNTVDDGITVAMNRGYYTLRDKNGRALSKTYPNALHRIDAGLFAGWIAENRYEIISCDGVHQARVLRTENVPFYNMDMDGGGLYLMQTSPNSFVIFDAAGKTYGQIALGASTGSARFVNGIVRVVVNEINKKVYFLPNSKQLPLQREWSETEQRSVWSITSASQGFIYAGTGDFDDAADVSRSDIWVARPRRD